MNIADSLIDTIKGYVIPTIITGSLKYASNVQTGLNYSLTNRAAALGLNSILILGSGIAALAFAKKAYHQEGNLLNSSLDSKKSILYITSGVFLAFSLYQLYTETNHLMMLGHIVTACNLRKSIDPSESEDEWTATWINLTCQKYLQN